MVRFLWLLLILPGVAPAQPTPSGPLIAHLGKAGGDASGLAAIRRAFAQRNPGYDLAHHDPTRALSAANHDRVVFVQRGSATVRVGELQAAGVGVGDVVLVRKGEPLLASAPLGLVTFDTPSTLPSSLPSVIRPDHDPKITDTPGGCATESDAYRRILLTWQNGKGPYICHAINAHRVRIDDSFTHYHPARGGFDEFYLVQGARPTARLLTSTRTDLIERPHRVTAEQAGKLLDEHPLAVGDLVYIPRDVVHRGLGGVLAHVIAVPGFRPGGEIGVDHFLRAINNRLALDAGRALPLHGQAVTKGIAFEHRADRVRVTCDGELFTEYLHAGQPKPILYPVIGPSRRPLTRNWPLKEAPHEKHDHPHQRSLWFAHGDVNRHDFWTEGKGRGRIEHVRFVDAGDARALKSENRWVAADGAVVCTDTRTLAFHATSKARFVEFAVTLHASHGALKLGDTKEGTMAIRLRPELRLEGPVAAGRVVNSEGVKGRAAWGKRAAWVSYFGDVEGKVVAVTILDNPANHGHPTWWHARAYGLFAANPFGAHDFAKKPRGTGDLVIKNGQSLTLRYLFAFHAGPTDAATVARLRALWAAR